MKTMKAETELCSFLKLFNARLQVFNLLSYFLLLSCLLCLGVFLVFYGKTMTLDLQVTQLQVSSDSDPISPPPPLQKKLQSNEEKGKTKPENQMGPSVRRKYPEPPTVAMHGMDDAELMWRASRTPRNLGEDEMAADIVPKVAFMFLIKGPLPLAPLWDMFFRGHEGLFSIYVHSDPSFNESLPASSVFHDRRVPSKEVEWGKVSMIEAERRLLANALLDYANQRFVLVSESCIPLFNFSVIYSYLMNTNETFVECYDKEGPVGQGRYSNLMRPQVRIEQWRKGSQWFQIDRDLAMDAVTDRKYFPVFQKYCRGRCYSDEHYLPTFVYIKSGWKNANRTLTWVDWSTNGAHPVRFMREHVTFEFLEWLRSGHTCQYNGKSSNVCHLFARKFGTHALDRLLRFAPKVMHFDT